MYIADGVELSMIDDRTFICSNTLSVNGIVIKNRFGYAGANDIDALLEAVCSVHESSKILNDSTGNVAYEVFSCVLKCYENFFRVTIPRAYIEPMLQMEIMSFREMIRHLTIEIVSAAQQGHEDRPATLPTARDESE